MQQALNSILETGIANAAHATLLALVVLVVTRVWRNAQVAHLLWLLVLVKLIVPTCWTVTIPVPPLEFVLTRPDDPATVSSSSIDDVEGDSLFSALSAETNRQVGWDEVLASEDVEWEGPAQVSSMTSPGTTASAVGWQALILLVWVSGSVVWTIVVAGRISSFRRLLQETRPASGTLEQQAQRFTAALGLRRCPEIRTTAGCISPLVWAVGSRPLILLPTELLKELDDCQQASLLAHEMAHIRRQDYWIRWLEFLVLAVYWWNPVAWWVRWQLQAAEEECCDAWVVSLMGNESKNYAQALWKTIHWLSQRQQSLPQMASGMGRVGSITRRFEMIVRHKTKTEMTWCTRLTLATAALVILPLSAHVAVFAEERTPPTEEVESGEVAEATDETDPSLEVVSNPPTHYLEAYLALADSLQAKTPREDDLAERLGRLEKMVMELAQAVKSQHVAQNSWQPARAKEQTKSAVQQGNSANTWLQQFRNAEQLFQIAAQTQQQQAKLAAHRAAAVASAQAKNNPQLEQQRGIVAQALEQQQKALLAAHRVAALAQATNDPERKLRQLEHEKQNLRNQLRIKELEIEKFQLEIDFLHAQLEAVKSEVEKAKKVTR